MGEQSRRKPELAVTVTHLVTLLGDERLQPTIDNGLRRVAVVGPRTLTKAVRFSNSATSPVISPNGTILSPIFFLSDHCAGVCAHAARASVSLVLPNATSSPRAATIETF
ncbi:hypothetical protein [Nocardia sp. NPDC052112]|uniref:hypothetical protein n=1 Tax=Nocardia sp. NPDC052112 TaxID=3155646 RepID=UPI00342999C8